LKTLVLLGGLILLVVVVVAGFILASHSAKNAEKEKAALRDPDPAVRRQAEERKQKERVANERAADDAADKAKVAMGAGVVIAIVIVATLYVAFVLLAGAWVAKDAYARGMNGLGWASFYYLFQMLSRASVVVVLLFPLSLFGLPIVGMLLGEPVYWVGLFVYLLARRSGQLIRCTVCRNKQLGYLGACPHCGHKV
jgi:hypothetical protein